MAELDALDQKIIEELRTNARIAHAKLGHKLGVSKSTVSRRIERLTREGFVRLVALVDPRKIGLRVMALVFLKVAPQRVDDVVARLQALPGVGLVLVTAGRFDVVIDAAVSSPEDLAQFVKKDLGAIEGILSTETLVVLELRKHPRIALPE